MNVFQFLKERYKMHLLLKPSKKDFLLYKRPDCVVLSNLFTESPLKYSRPHDIRIEKLLVDTFCGKLISAIFEEEKLKTLFYKADELYTIDKRGLLRYANRRGKKEDIEGFAPEIFEHEKSIEEKIQNDKSKIRSSIRSIVEQFPKSQQILFEHLDSYMSQAEIARSLGITPQAVDQRVQRLFVAADA